MQNSGCGIKVGGYTGGRKAGGYSLRESLVAQGVTSELGMREHMSFVHATLAVNPRLDITRYRVNPNYPNGAINSA